MPSEGPVSEGVHRREQRDGDVMDGLGRGPGGRVWCGGRDLQGGLRWHQSHLHSLFLRSQPRAKGRIFNRSHLFRCFDTGWHFLAGHSVKFRGPVDPSWGSGRRGRGGGAEQARGWSDDRFADSSSPMLWKSVFSKSSRGHGAALRSCRPSHTALLAPSEIDPDGELWVQVCRRSTGPFLGLRGFTQIGCLCDGAACELPEPRVHSLCG